MDQDELLSKIEDALNRMERDIWELSKINYSEYPPNSRKIAEDIKVLERPFAYEFYHEFRKMMEGGEIDFDDSREMLKLQAEVSKKYQETSLGDVNPDFIFHIPDKHGEGANFAVIEFKLASRRIEKIKKDLKKLLEFKNKPELNYQTLVEVLIGKQSDLKDKMNNIRERETSGGTKIDILKFDVETEKVDKEEVNLKIEDLRDK